MHATFKEHMPNSQPIVAMGTPHCTAMLQAVYQPIATLKALPSPDSSRSAARPA